MTTAFPRFRQLWKHDLALALSVLALYHEVVFGSARVLGRDVLLYLMPVGAALRRGALGGDSLLWDSGVDHGLPLVARWAPMVFYPGQWLHLLFEPITAISVGIVLHLILAACAVMRLALRYTPSIPAAWVAGVSFACSGYVISVAVGGGYLYGATLLPLSLLCLHRLAELPSGGRVAQLAGVIALQVFCADPQTLFYEGLLLGPAVVLLYPGGNGTRVRRFVLAGGAVALAIGVSACQWIPAVEFASLSTRARGLAAEHSDTWSFHPLRLAQVFSAHVFGAVTPQNTFWARSLVNGEFWMPWAPLIYNGLLVWAGIVALDWRKRTVQLIGGLTLLFLGLSFGGWAPLYPLVLRFLPGANLFRYPEKFLLFVALGICLLGAIGLGQLSEGLGSDELAARRRRLRVGVVFALIAAVAGGLRLWLDPTSGPRLAWFTQVLAGQGADDVPPELGLAVTASSLLHTAAIAALIGLLCFFARRVRPVILLASVGLIAVADVIPEALPDRYLAESGPFLRAPTACQWLPGPTQGLPPLVWRYQPRVFVQDLPIKDDDGTRFEVDRRWDWDTVKANTGAMSCLRYADGYEAARMQTYRQLWVALENVEVRRLQLFGVQYVVAVRGSVDAKKFPSVLVADDLNAQLHSVPGALPYAHAVGRAESVPDLDAAVRRLSDGSFDFNQAVVLEGPSPAADFGEASRQATLRAWHSGDLSLDVDFAAPGYLVLEESYYPGWRGELDGHPLPVERANAHFLAAAIPAGTHAVRFVFDPPLQRRADWVSLVSILALFGAVGFGAIRRGGSPAVSVP